MQSTGTFSTKVNLAVIGWGLLALMSVKTASARVILSPLFSDNMVLQQKDKVALWGTAAPNKQLVITTSWNHKNYTLNTDAAGAWKTKVPTPKAGGPYNITFNDGETTILKDVLIGEVWICSGQSNMEMPLEGWGKIKNYKAEIALADHPNIRLLNVEKITSTQPLPEAKFLKGWQPCSPETVANFSAASYHKHS